ncbi:MAG: PepSY domain-containing protein [Proteobacteria bacterium]|nr:PepSY domain-containing protein [Pseudomonadota bacterium]
MKFKPLLFSIHRLLGIGMCLLFALWFASGIVMMYVEYPELTEAERIANLDELDLGNIRITPAQAAVSLRSNSNFSALTLSSVLGRPAYQFQDLEGTMVTVFADTGQIFDGLDSSSAVAAASYSGFAAAAITPRYDGKIEIDQWTVSASLDGLRPLHRVQMNDAAGTVVYISDISGQIVRDSDRNERFWNWLGSTIHWIYPVQLRRNVDLWVQVIIYVSLVGIVSVVSGAIIGFMRIRVRKPYRGMDVSPYRGMMKWHHVMGLLTLVFVSTFIFSGLMSMGPWGIFESSTSAQPQIARYRGANTLQLATLPPPNFNRLGSSIKEIRWHNISSVPYLVATTSTGDRLVDFGTRHVKNQQADLLGRIVQAIPKLLPESKLTSMDFIQQYDDYYYSRHNRYRPLPIYRAKFDDTESTWYHIDLTTGEVVNRLTDAGRLERWLFNGLHSLDFQFLLQRRPLWDIVVILLSVIGFVFSVTAVVIGWRKLTG